MPLKRSGSRIIGDIIDSVLLRSLSYLCKPMAAKKQIIFNDPIYGFITVPDPLILQVINHPYFLRLQRIRQLGLTSLVYPGALHNRFQHAMGAMYLTQKAVETLRAKGVRINKEEERGVLLAVLLHDVGHGPFSHALEHSIVSGVSHEDISELFLESLDRQFNGGLRVARKIFNGSYRRKFLHQLVSGQLDMDRMDYLNRDSFFTGVPEGVVNWDRIIKMLNVKKNELVVESKGMYSVEKFLIARRLMYWQVYLHKTVLSAEFLVEKILKRARELSLRRKNIFATPALKTFLTINVNKKNMQQYLDDFAMLDDSDIFACVKAWMKDPDPVLSRLCKMLVNRNLYKAVVQNSAISAKRISLLRKRVMKKYKLNEREVRYFVFSETASNDAYAPDKISINILLKSGQTIDIARASDRQYLGNLQKTVKRHFLYFPKEFLRK